MTKRKRQRFLKVNKKYKVRPDVTKKNSKSTISKIYKIFIEPIININEQFEEQPYRLHDLLLLNERPITTYKATEEIFIEAMEREIAPKLYRIETEIKIPKNSLLYLRKDLKKNTWELEALVHNSYKVFKINLGIFNKIKNKLVLHKSIRPNYRHPKTSDMDL
ncbi:MAG: hypothetical protein GTN36_02675 [Candidatus Aenigmarchaeota archaeon]|nr:hypothetical protein [Candidatus Aenigmarchaeota archaeon]